MDQAALDALEWLAPWVRCRPGLEAELAREVGPGHPLAGRRAVAVGRRLDTDDVLFFLPEGPAPLAVVHLSWTGRCETRPEWPWTELYTSIPDWVERRMRADHAECGPSEP
jgi:hypothetical protein